ncbi:LodA/GoxA family CTQ-dependent oxidase [Salipiger mucosus]|uniref:Lysine-epsilon oxidase antimicrobial protein LodA n=1 Tax=Salipiger mucosus DSM 16094 TaxID=1123237 RepID=S9RW82_9RHOB|nr:LodA/GoxA family CTQ-dependent oxidase [Salipiger mucosus]EPX82290.1 Lysine-epsilon oxidase antimicrobial protein LodA [Salipiger mucosus DSM 16094]
MNGDITRIRVHPGIGIARLGDSEDPETKYFIGPEAPGAVPDPGPPEGPGPEGGSYRDAEMRLKRQAQRFRVYAYDANDTCIGELTTAECESISWRVHVRNMKAANYAFQGAYLFDPTQLRNPNIQGDTADPIDRTDLIIDPGPQTIDQGQSEELRLAGDVFTNVGESQLPGYLDYDDPELCTRDPAQFVTVTYTPATDVEIGRIKADDAGRLIFIAGPGKADCVTTPRIKLSNPSEHFEAPNGPTLEDRRYQPLVNQFAYFNVPGWWDDTCGGEIDATVVLKDGTVLSTRDGVTAPGDAGTRNAENGAWVVTAPPKYAPYMYHVVSIKDRVLEAFPEADPTRGQPTDFYRDVYPILSRAVNYGWVSAEAAGVTPANRNLAHGPKQAGNLLSEANLAVLSDPSEAARFARSQIYRLMRDAEGGSLRATLPDPPPAPAGPPVQARRGARGNKMPKLWGTGGKPLQNAQLGNNLPNQYLSLTRNDLDRLRDWAEGNFETGAPVPVQPLADYPVAEQPFALDCAAVEPTIGGGFHPGIEFPYLICYPELFAGAFRVAQGTEPGSVAAYMSSPWQGDYWSCNTAWWPVQRPEIVFTYDQSDGSRSYREWFRGYDSHGQPLSGSDGYDQMVYAWPKLGMVLPVKAEGGGFVMQNGSVVYEEFERDPSLNAPPENPKPVACPTELAETDDDA